MLNSWSSTMSMRYCSLMISVIVDVKYLDSSPILNFISPEPILEKLANI